MQIGELIGSGRDADVYALDDGWVVRRNRNGRPLTRETAVMAHVHAHGYPVPEVRPTGPNAPADLVMRRVDGPTLLEAALAGEIDADGAGAMLAELLIRLHTVPALGSADSAASAASAGNADNAADETAILHLDLHPLNVILSTDGPMVIDWTNTREDRPALDWAMSALILAQVALDGSELSKPTAELLSSLLPHRPPTIVLDDAVMARARAERAADPHAGAQNLDAAVALVIARAG